MTKDKWLDVIEQEHTKYEAVLRSIDYELDPKNWPTVKNALIGLVKVVDEATEVYNTENKV